MNIRLEKWKLFGAALLITITVLAVLLQAFVLHKVLVLDAHSPIPFKSLDDRMDGGASIARVEVVGNKLMLHCEIVPSAYQWPYCELTFDFGKKGSAQGVDLSGYAKMRVWAKYSGEVDLGLRVQTKNFNPSYSRLTDYGSFKFNGIEYHTINNAYPAVIPLSGFQVPTWWLADRQLPIAETGPDFSNTHTVEVATGSGIKPGKYTIEIERIEFVGKYISDDRLYLILLGLWGASALVYFVISARDVRFELRRAWVRQQELESLNKLLNVKQQKLEEKANRDPLTGVLNRDGMYRLFESNARAHRHLSLSIMFIDIDFFKKINDGYGHHVGDEVLVLFARILSGNTREIDMLARWGGEEFLLACPNTDVQSARKLAEKLRACIEKADWPQGIKVTASFGVAEMQEETPAELIARADHALYEAKRNGRNRVEVAGTRPDALHPPHSA